MGDLVRKPFTAVLKPKQIQDIYAKVFGEGEMIKTMAEEYGVHRNTIYNHLTSEEGKKAKRDIERAMAAEARGILVKNARTAAQSWVEQLELANQGQRANHQPAKDLLTHIEALDIPVPTKERGTQILIQIGGGTISDVRAIEAEVIEEVE